MFSAWGTSSRWRAAQEAAERGDTRVGHLGPLPHRLAVGLASCGTWRSGRRAALADPRLAVEQRATVGEQVADGDERHEHEERHEADEAERHVETRLSRP